MPGPSGAAERAVLWNHNPALPVLAEWPWMVVNQPNLCLEILPTDFCTVAVLHELTGSKPVVCKYPALLLACRSCLRGK